MNCNDYIIWISGHMDGTNSKKDEEMLQAHLSGCAHCRQVLANMEANESAMKEEQLTPPLRIRDHVMATVRKDAAAKRKARFRTYFTSVAATAAVLCLVMLASVQVPRWIHNGDRDLGAEIPTMANATDSIEAPGAEIPAYAGGETPTLSMEGAEVTGDDPRDTRTRRAEKNMAAHCIFVELSSREDMPMDLPTLTTEEFMSRVNREAIDYYFYGGSMIYGAVEMSYEDLSQWEDRINGRFLQENAQTESYIVVFCSESR